MNDECSTHKEGATSRLNRYVEKFAWWIVGVVITICGALYTNATDRITILEDRVSFLYQDKVSRAELKEVTAELRTQNDVNKADIMSQQANMKNDILSRLDYLLRIYPPTNNHSNSK